MGKNDFDINLKNCRNVKSVDGDSILIKMNTLNVFYGKNGTGKTTFGKALEYLYEKTDVKKLSLSSYQYLASGNADDEPDLTCKPRIKNLLVFNDEWVDAHCFSKSTVHQNTFELYVRDAEVKKLEKQRQKKLSQLTAVLQSNDVAELRISLTSLQKGLGKLKADGTFMASAPTVKAFKAGVPTETVPRCLAPVTSKMNAIEKAKWLEWHVRRPDTHDNDVCPYCGNMDQTRMKSCAEYDESRDKSAVKQWAQMASSFDSVGSRLSRANRTLMGNVLKSKEKPSDDEVERLARLSSDAVQALEAIDEIVNALSDEKCADTKVLAATLKTQADVLSSCRIFLKTKDGKKTTEAKAISQLINATEGVISAQEDLENLSSDLITRITANIDGHEGEIDEFLRQCGYQYKVKIETNPQTSEAKMLLTSSVSSQVIEDPKESLSYGEKNALALVLFMFEALHEKKPLVVLDDPISSFDYDKRYGVLYALFAKGCVNPKWCL